MFGRKWIAAWAVLAYSLRFLSSWVVVAWTGAEKFDPHGFGLLGDFVQLNAMALPLLGLLIWTVRRRQPWHGLFAPASSPAWTILSIVLLMLVGTPTLGQVWSVILLPVTESWPVLASVVVWFATVAVLRGMAVSPPRPAYEPATVAS